MGQHLQEESIMDKTTVMQQQWLRIEEVREERRRKQDFFKICIGGNRRVAELQQGKEIDQRAESIFFSSNIL